MYYKLNQDLGLRGWEQAPHAVRVFSTGATLFVSAEEFQALSFCNGLFDCSSMLLTPLHKKIIEMAEKNKAILPCEKGDVLDARQEYILYPCRFIDRAHWSITGKCNMKCRHCMLSAPHAKFGEISHEMAMSIVDQLAAAGVGKVSLTGGEPLIREDFWDIIDALIARDINIFQICTNGILVNDELLNGLEARGAKPNFAISFDGPGWHDWMRGYDDAEEIALRAFRLLKARGFRTSCESAFHRDSLGTIVETMHVLADAGVSSWKTNPVSDSGEWLQESRDLDLTAEETYAAYLNLITEFYKAGSPLTIQLGGFFGCEKGETQHYFPIKKLYKDETLRLAEPLCMSARRTMYISAEGKLLPCIPLSGMPTHDEYPSLHDMPLTQALSESLYLSRITAPVSELLSKQAECAACKYKLHCNGGCRAAALSANGGTDFFGIDPWTCLFFKGEYEAKINEVVERALK